MKTKRTPLTQASLLLRQRLCHLLNVQKERAPMLRAAKIKSGNEGCILVDFDKQWLPLDFVAIISTCLTTMHLRHCYTRTERTTNGWHIIIRTVEDLSPGLLLLAQAVMCCALEGDWKREACNFRRARNKVFLNVLFEPEDTKK